jgi:hypothetical protein
MGLVETRLAIIPGGGEHDSVQYLLILLNIWSVKWLK